MAKLWILDNPSFAQEKQTKIQSDNNLMCLFFCWLFNINTFKKLLGNFQSRNYSTSNPHQFASLERYRYPIPFFLSFIPNIPLLSFSIINILPFSLLSYQSLYQLYRQPYRIFLFLFSKVSLP